MAIYKLEDIGFFKGGISNLVKSNYDKGINFVNYMDIFKNPFISDCISLRKYNASIKDLNKYSLKFGDALFTASSETPEEIAISTIYLSNKSAIFNGFSKKFTFNQNILSPFYATYLFRNSKFRNQARGFATGYTRYNISQKNLGNIKINIPSLEIQKDIIGIIKQNEKLFLNYPNCVRIDSFKNTKNDMQKLIDIIRPIETQIQKLKEIIIAINSFLNKMSLSDEIFKISEISEYRKQPPKNIYQISAKILNKRTPLISKLEQPQTYKSNTFFLSKGTLVINTIRTYLEKFGITPSDVDGNGTLVGLKIQSKFETSILANLLQNSFWKQVNQLNQGTKMPIITRKDLLNIKVKSTHVQIKNLFHFITNISNLISNLKILKKQVIQILVK